MTPSELRKRSEQGRLRMANEKIDVHAELAACQQRAEQAEAALVLAETALHRLVETGLTPYDTRREMARKAGTDA